MLCSGRFPAREPFDLFCEIINEIAILFRKNYLPNSPMSDYLKKL